MQKESTWPILLDRMQAGGDGMRHLLQEMRRADPALYEHSLVTAWPALLMPGLLLLGLVLKFQDSLLPS